MVFQEKYGSRQKAHTRPWRHASMGVELLGDLIPSGKLNIYQGHAYPKFFREIQAKYVDFVLAYTQSDVKSDIFVEIPIGLGVEGYHPI